MPKSYKNQPIFDYKCQTLCLFSIKNVKICTVFENKLIKRKTIDINVRNIRTPKKSICSNNDMVTGNILFNNILVLSHSGLPKMII